MGTVSILGKNRELFNVRYGKEIEERGGIYRQILFHRNDELGNLIGEKELYFRCDGDYIIPEFHSTADVRRFWSYANHAKLNVKVKTMYDVVEY